MSLRLVCEGSRWILTCLPKPMYESQKSEDPFPDSHVQKLRVITLFTWYKSKKSSKLKDSTHPTEELGWLGPAHASPFPIAKHGLLWPAVS